MLLLKGMGVVVVAYEDSPPQAHGKSARRVSLSDLVSVAGGKGCSCAEALQVLEPKVARHLLIR